MKSFQPILKTNHLTKRFNGIAAVENLSISVEKACITSIIGPNGAGKTTLFNLITGFLKSDEGDYYIEDKKITGFPPYQITRMGMARTFQIIRIFPKLSVLDNIMLGFLGLKGDNLFQAILKGKETVRQFQKSKELAMQILEIVGLHEFADQFASDLSYGQQKLIEIGRVLASDPNIVLMDEPMAGLSITMIDRMIELIFGLCKQNKTIVIVEHNMPVVMDISTHIIVLNYGKKLATGSPEEIQKNEKVIDAYLGI